MNPYLALGPGVLALVGTYVSFKHFGSLWAPLGIMSLSWWGPLALCATGIVAYVPISTSGWIAFGCSFAAFAVGCALVPSGRAHGLAQPTWDTRRLMKATAVLWFCGTFAALVNVSLVAEDYGLSTYIYEPLTVKAHFAQPGWGALYICNFVVLAMVWLCWHRMPKRRVLLASMAAVTILCLISAAQRRSLVTSLVVALVAQQFVSRSSIRRPLTVVALILAFFSAYSWFKSPYYDGDWRYYVKSGAISLPQRLAPLSNPLFYLTSPYPVFDAFINAHYEVERGETFIALINLASKVDPFVKQPTNLLEEVDVPMPTNVYTYLRPFYVDFGWPGILIGPFVIGYVTTRLYRRARSTQCVTPILLYASCAWCLCMSFFSNHFVYTATFLMWGFGLMAGVYVDRQLPRWLNFYKQSKPRRLRSAHVS
jgi:hypothetical protein